MRGFERATVRRVLRSMGPLLVALARVVALRAQAGAPSCVDSIGPIQRRLVLPLSRTEHDRVEAVTPLPDGRAVAAGWVLRGGDSYSIVFRLDARGRVDSTFGSAGDGIVALNARPGGEEEKPRAVVVQRDGRIVVAGQVEGSASQSNDFLLFRLMPDGRLDSAFAGGRGVVVQHLEGPVDKIRSLALLPDDRLVVVGHSADAFAVARYTRDGIPDSSFAVNGVLTVRFPGENQGRGVALLRDGSLVVSGYARFTHGDEARAKTYVLRVTPSGTLDTAWAPGGAMSLDLGAPEVRAYVAAPTRDGGWLVGGRLRAEGGTADFFIARFDSRGRVDPGFGRSGVVRVDFGGGDDTVRGLVELADGRVVAAGFSILSEGAENFAVIVLRRDGTPDPRFALRGCRLIDFSRENDKLRGLALLPGPTILLFGHAERGGQRDIAFAWLRP